MLPNFSVADLRNRVRWYVGLRWFYLLILAVAGLGPLYLNTGWSEDFRRQSMIAVFGVLLNVVVLLITNYRFLTKAWCLILATAQISFDLFLVTWILYQNGGIESRSIILYAIPIVMTGALFGRLAIYLTATISAVAYIILISLDHYGIIQPPNAIFEFAHKDYFFYISSIFFYTSVFMALAVVTDYVGRLIREREELQEEMRALGSEKAETEAILKTMGSALVAVDRDGQIKMINDSFEELTGWKRTEVIGRQLENILPILDTEGKRMRAETRPLLQFAGLPEGESHVRSVSGYTYVRRDGSTFPFVEYLAPIVLGKHIIGATAVFDDATNSKKLEQLKSNFVALVSHQLKTPIGEIRGYVDNMLYGLSGKLTIKQQEYLNHIREVTDRSNKLITDLLDITVLEKGGLSIDFEEVKLSDVVKEVAHVYHERLEKSGLKFDIQKISPTTRVLADFNKLVEVVGNILANSISYSKEGTITITTDHKENYGQICVSDQGIGMEKATLDTIFNKEEVLSGVPTAEGGTGLGLYLARQLIEFMKGEIKVVETSGQGTTICIKLPLVKG